MSTERKKCYKQPCHAMHGHATCVYVDSDTGIACHMSCKVLIIVIESEKLISISFSGLLSQNIEYLLLDSGI